MDRMALDDPRPGPLSAAAEPAERLVLHDRRHPDLVAGPLRPNAITHATTCRLYVRQEYAAWTATRPPGHPATHSLAREVRVPMPDAAGRAS
ncbi:hypothetical protein ACFYZJ_11240 [Streptomyces sp. NPDC001848]|uniref:hypothetical protein n=1 Tax=Streptomyces sp. NPDC001848 TaxID=3364618 RepID=UPI003690F3FE